MGVAPVKTSAVMGDSSASVQMAARVRSGLAGGSGAASAVSGGGGNGADETSIWAVAPIVMIARILQHQPDCTADGCVSPDKSSGVWRSGRWHQGGEGRGWAEHEETVTGA
ncbi:MAG: hypothetical protein H0U76_07750 [Ktedonobacteraceae bacterium]|nr:hypothetical protein [Ktedonobacteraceae bacterium]